VDLRTLGRYDWRLSPCNVWKVERLLFEIPHRPIRSAPARVARLRAKYLAFIEAHPGQKPLYYKRRGWTELPRHFWTGRGRSQKSEVSRKKAGRKMASGSAFLTSDL
jgi:hypothetical protein